MQKTSQSIRLLIVDDEEEFRIATGKALTRRGFEIMTAASGEEGIDVIRQESVDIVMLDLRMPGLDGIETLRLIRETDSSIPVIILTGQGSFEDALSGINLKIVDYIQKPVDIDELEAKIRKFLEYEEAQPLRERTIVELMASPDLFPKIYEDQPVKEALQAFQKVFFPEGREEDHPDKVRSALVYDRSDRFLGMIRFHDFLKLVMPPFLGDSPYSTYFTGMFLAICKTVRERKIVEIVGDLVAINVNSPLMEAIHLLLKYRLNTLPVMDGDELVGILREKDVILHIAENLCAPQ